MGRQYRVCPFCGDHLDAGEVCDCRREIEQEREERHGTYQHHAGHHAEGEGKGAGLQGLHGALQQSHHKTGRGGVAGVA